MFNNSLFASIVLGSVLGIISACVTATPASVPQSNANIIIANLNEVPVHGGIVPFDAELFYSEADLQYGTPVQIRDAQGKTVPVYYNQERDEILVFISLAARDSLQLSIEPTEFWQEREQILTVEADERRGRAVIYNGIISAVYENEEFTVYLGNQDEKIMERFTQHKDFWNANPAFVDETTSEGWIRLFRNHSQIIELSADVLEDDSLQITVRRQFTLPAVAKDVVYKETFRLLPYQPIIEYRMILSNPTHEYFFFRDGVSNGFSTVLSGRFQTQAQVLRGDGEILQEGRLRWVKPRWVSILGGDDFGVTFSLLKANLPDDRFFDQHRVRIGQHRAHQVAFSQPGIHHGAAASDIWMQLPPNDKEEYGVLIHLFYPGQFMREIKTENWRAWNQGQDISVSPPLLAIINGKVVYAGASPNFTDRFDKLDNWVSVGGHVSLNDGLKLARLDDQAGAVITALELDFNSEQEIRGYISALDAAGLTVSITDLVTNGEQTVTISDLGEFSVSLNELTGLQGINDVLIKLETHGSGSVHIADINIGDPLSVSPVLISPLDGVDLTDYAVYYRWHPVGGALEYELQISRSDDFSDATSLEVRKTRSRDVLWFPYDTLDTGQWYWRVRAIVSGFEGEWSETRKFTVNDLHVRAPLQRDITPDNPLIGMRIEHNAKHNFLERVSHDLRPHLVILDRMQRWEERMPGFYQYLDYLAEHDIPIIFEVLTWKLPDYPSLTDLEYAFQHYPNVIGVTVHERFFYFWGQHAPGSVHYRSKEFMEKLFNLTTKYGRFFFWGDQHGFNWARLVEEWDYITPENAPYFVPLLKTTMTDRLAYGAATLQGFALTDIADVFGIQADSFYWHDNRNVPATVYLQHWLLNMMHGGLVFNNECGHIWRGQAHPNPLWSDYVEPFFSGIIRYQLIPTEEQVLSSTKFAVEAQLPRGMSFSQPNSLGTGFGPFTELYLATYGIEETRSVFIPPNGRYGLIPIIPPGRIAPEGIDVVSLLELQDADSIRRKLEQVSRLDYEGDAFYSRVGDTLAILNSNVTENVMQSFDIPIEDSIVKNIWGEVRLHQYIMGKVDQEQEFLWLQTNVPEPTGTTELSFQMHRKPQLEVTPASALIASEWDITTGVFSVSLSMTDGVVELLIRESQACSRDTITEFSTIAPAAGVTIEPIRPLFRWETAYGAAGYRVMVARDADFSELVFDNLSSETTIEIPGLMHNSQYYWKVIALSEEDEAFRYFRTDTATVTQFQTKEVAQLPPVPEISAIVKGVEHVSLLWDPSPLAYDYHIYRKEEGAQEFTLIAENLGKDASRFDDVDVNIGVTYQYKLAASNPIGFSDTSPPRNLTMRPANALLTEDYLDGFDERVIRSGRWSLDDNVATLRAIFPMAMGSATVYDLTGENYRVTLEFRIGEIGIEQFAVIRLTTSTQERNRYQLMYWHADRVLSLEKRTDSGTVELARLDFSLQPSQNYRLDFVVHLGTLALDIDGIRVFEVSDEDPLGGGGIEVYINNMVILFEQLNVVGR